MVFFSLLRLIASNIFIRQKRFAPFSTSTDDSQAKGKKQTAFSMKMRLHIIDKEDTSEFRVLGCLANNVVLGK